MSNTEQLRRTVEALGAMFDANRCKRDIGAMSREVYRLESVGLRVPARLRTRLDNARADLGDDRAQYADREPVGQ